MNTDSGGSSGRPITMPGDLGRLAQVMGGVGELAELLKIPIRTLRSWASEETKPNALAQAEIDRLLTLYLSNPEGTRQFVVEILRVNDRRTGAAYLNSFVSVVRKPINLGMLRKKVSLDGLLHELEPEIVYKKPQQRPGGNLVISWLDLLIQENSEGVVLRLRKLPGPVDESDLPYRDNVDRAMLEFGTQMDIAGDTRKLRREYSDLLEVAFTHYIQARKTIDLPQGVEKTADVERKKVD